MMFARKYTTINCKNINEITEKQGMDCSKGIFGFLG